MGVKLIKSRVATVRVGLSTPPIAQERIRGRQCQATRKRIALRDEFRCQECGKIATNGHVDHTVPLHLGGGNHDGNLQWLCIECHDIKTTAEAEDRQI